jgi:hypothetical protein
MISFDGDRSKKRKWFANKQLAVIKDIDVPTKAVQWDGFTFKVWQQEELNGGRITAPMGAVVLMSTYTGIEVAVADYWAGGFTSRADLHMLYTPLTYGETKLISINNIPADEMTDYIAVTEKPMGVYDVFGLDPDGSIGTETVWCLNRPSFPVVLPYKAAEAFCINFTDPMFVDLNNNGTADYPFIACESSIVFYASDSSNLGGRRTISILDYGESLLLGGVYQPWRMLQYVSPTKAICFHSGLWYDTQDTNVIVARALDFPTITDIYASDIILATSMPTNLKDIMFDVTDLVVRPLGSYACSVNGVEIFLHGVDATTYEFPGASGLADYYTAHSEDENWKLFFVLKVGATSYVFNSSQFMSLLDSLADVPVSGDWYSSMKMFEQLFSNPNNNFLIPYDSVMFHAHTGDIYSWSRKYGAVRFSSTGLFAATIVLPTEVTTEEGVTPNISYAYEDPYTSTPLYLCICESPGYDGTIKVGDENVLTYPVKEQGVRGIYYGTPFTSWTTLPGVSATQTLIHARPVKVTPTEIFIIGVIKESVLINEISTDKYFFASLKWVPESTEQWKRMAMLPFDGDTVGNFCAGLFGEHPMVQALTDYLTRSTVRPQIPVGPYSKYAIGMP